eukprot:scaffold28459_cov28-Phaeocystis_antarctica.AAC.1
MDSASAVDRPSDSARVRARGKPSSRLLISVPAVSWQVCTAALSFSDGMTWRMSKEWAWKSSRPPRTRRCTHLWRVPAWQ